MSFVRSLQMIAMKAEEGYSHIRIRVESTAQARQFDYARSRLMPMVWMNIFRNTAQHAGPEPEVLVSISYEEDSFYITVVDNGPGISDEDAEWLFVRGTREERDFRGMGLYLARTIIESHGGTIELLDKVGCKIGIRLPIQLEM
ncbi:MAG: ATP-binding protein [Candidatus Thorarchaeota archaeon]|nr:ATP-binding protein [Candidatus Thorarchaeota archaeon]